MSLLRDLLIVKFDHRINEEDIFSIFFAIVDDRWMSGYRKFLRLQF